MQLNGWEGAMTRKLALCCALFAVGLIGAMAPAISAGERHRNTVSLELNGSLIATGEVRATDGTRACEARREVLLQLRGSGGAWQTVATKNSRATGTYRIQLSDEDGDYRALVEKLQVDNGTCTRDVSPVVTHGGDGDNCTPGYDPCLVDHGGADYDCYGGSGDGPYYTEPGVVYTVTGSDPYGLDADNDGRGCES